MKEKEKRKIEIKTTNYNNSNKTELKDITHCHRIIPV